MLGRRDACNVELARNKRPQLVSRHVLNLGKLAGLAAVA
jgi:hypothetical protein